MKEAMFIVCDLEGVVANVKLKIFGKVMLIPAIFLDEDDALHFMFEGQKQSLKATLEIRMVSNDFTATELV